jgi:hypothetical protein
MIYGIAYSDIEDERARAMGLEPYGIWEWLECRGQGILIHFVFSLLHLCILHLFFFLDF